MSFERYLRLCEAGSLIKGGSVVPNWSRDGSSFWFVEGDAVQKVDPVADTVETVPSLEESEPTPPTPQVVRKGYYGGAPDVLEVASPDGRWFAGVKEHNLYARSTLDGRLQFLTSDGVPGYEWDIQGTDMIGVSPARWSPDSLRLATTKSDTRAVVLTPVVHWLKTVEEVEWVRYPRSGQPIPRTELYIVDVLAREPVRVAGDEPDQIVDLLGWLPSGEFAFLRATRDLRTRALCVTDARTGASRTVLSETAAGAFSYLNWPGCCVLLPSGEGFVWWSDRDGWGHLYRYDMEGELRARLTQGEFPVHGRQFAGLGVVEIDEERRWVYLTAQAKERINDTHLYRVDFDGGNFTRLTEANGHHDVAVSPSREFFLDTHSSFDRPQRVDLRRADGTLVRTLSEADVSALEEIGWAPPEEFVVKADAGETDLYGILFTPPDFDPARTYPVVDCLYGGPQVKAVRPMFFDPFMGELGRDVAQALAQLGFVTFVVDGRGTPGRGAAFQNVVYRRFGRHEIPDHVATLKQLAAERPWMDVGRVGITGRSWGGYMTIRGLVLAPEVFRVGVALYPVADLWDHWAMPIEPFMGVPQDNVEGYEYASSLRLVDRIDGRLLILHGTNDLNAPFSSTIKLVDAMIRADKRVEMVPLAEENHVLSPPAKDYFHKALGRYFLEHL